MLTTPHPKAVQKPWGQLLRKTNVPITQKVPRYLGVLCLEQGERPNNRTKDVFSIFIA